MKVILGEVRDEHLYPDIDKNIPIPWVIKGNEK